MIGGGRVKVKAAKAVVKNAGRAGGSTKLRQLATDQNVSRSLRGWIKQEINEMKRKKKKHLRNPPGYQLAHRRGEESRKENYILL
ncbi:polymorphic toxin type 8 domain-containing protein [Bacillus paramycoides]|uniref:polymorphic toxin type 8 domain-containing protein n=1 Tax=Bacillus paramycoides TaxID=2026194 RepID=UPI0015B862E1|nr:polymorphic toxin type 8 domain-containing protein [Bacillus paramycoides]NWK72328.1 hypothetical protein [Bacillus paramycoides]